ncbi:ABC-type transport auxiliary lipoprotein family protein [Alphaproteobacteria bacterium]|nr:ABC-type transport auxiliary lipoprotein family protein [Alphaproteobacteria bacterium]
MTHLLKPHELLCFGRCAIIVLSVFLLSGCTSAPKRFPNQFYSLQASLPTQTYGKSVSIEVRPVSIRGVESSRPLVRLVSNNPIKLEEVKGHLWHMAPANMVQQVIADALSASSADAVFGTSDSVIDADYRLKLSVHRLAFSFGGSAILTFDATLTASNESVVHTRRYLSEAELNSKEIDSAVNAYSLALSSSLKNLSTDIAKAIEATELK